MKNIFTILISLFALTVSNAQTNLELANEAFASRQYSDALGLYQKILSKPDKKTDVAEVTFKVAECYRYTGKPNDAVEWYDQAKAKGYADPNYLFHQGTIYLKQGEYKMAQSKFEKFLTLQPNDKDATRLLNNCMFALITGKDSSVYTIKNETAINSAYSDYGGVPVKYLLFFTSSRIEEKSADVYSFDGQGFSDLYQAVYLREDKTWGKPKKVDALNSPFNDGIFTCCEKTKTAYFTRCNSGKGKDNFCRIYEKSYTEVTNLSGAAKPILLSFEQKADMEQPAISSDGNKLYFASRMEGGLGGSDIWVMKKNGDNWGEPVNAGNSINTEFDEMFPVIKDSVLYFSSEGYIGYGGMDLFYSVFSDGQWNEPLNLKTPFNSSADDFYLTYNSDNKSGYFSSNRSGGAGSDDIYSFFLTPVLLTVKGRITDQETNEPLAGVTVILGLKNKAGDTAVTNANGEYIFNMEAGKEYKVSAQNSGYFGDSKKLSTEGEKFSKEFSKASGYNYDFAIKKIPKTEIKIDNIYYDLDKYVLREESKPSLDKLAKIIEDTPDAFVQINSHTDERGKEEYNMLLSENRAQSVVNYLVLKGISRGRLSAKGFGFSQPVVKAAKAEEEHQMNRRTAFQVIKK